MSTRPSSESEALRPADLQRLRAQHEARLKRRGEARGSESEAVASAPVTRLAFIYDDDSAEVAAYLRIRGEEMAESFAAGFQYGMPGLSISAVQRASERYRTSREVEIATERRAEQARLRANTPEERAKAASVHRASRALVLHGSLGIGKTREVVSFIVEALRHRVVDATQVQFFEESGCTADGFRASDFRDAMKHPNLRILVIDDVGRARFGTPAKRLAFWDDICNWAYRAGVLLILTTNMSVEALGEWIGDAADDRLAEMTGQNGRVLLTNDGGSHRRRASARSAEPVDALVASEAPVDPFGTPAPLAAPSGAEDFD